jgi:hypothetical protein
MLSWAIAAEEVRQDKPNQSRAKLFAYLPVTTSKLAASPGKRLAGAPLATPCVYLKVIVSPFCWLSLRSYFKAAEKSQLHRSLRNHLLT